MNIQIPQQFEFLFKPRRYKVMYSGRAAAKSWSIAQALLVMGLSKKLRILCTREFQNSITDSVHKLLSDMNEKYQLGYEVTQTHIRHPGTKTEFMFYGLKTNITKIKSLESVDICWVEEAETISKGSLEVLIPTIRKEESEIWLSFNPADEQDAVYQRFVSPYADQMSETNVYADQRHYILRTSYADNPFLPSTIKEEISTMRESNYREYQHVYGGEPVADHEFSIIKPEWFDACIDAHIKLNIKPKGATVIGFDPADMGKDSKAYVMRKGLLVTKIDEWADGDLEEGVEKVYDQALHSGVQEIVYDSIGIGAGAKIKLNSYDTGQTILKTAFTGSAKVDNPHDLYQDNLSNRDMFRNKRAQYYWLLKDRFEATYRAITFNEYCDPDVLISLSSDLEHMSKLKSELTTIRRVRGTSSSLIQIESKENMRARGKASPNLSDALMYAYGSSLYNLTANPVVTLEFVSQW